MGPRGETLWWRISRQLAEEIAAGVYPPGAKMPTEAALTERFSVNRHTLRRAMSELRDRGLVRIEQGRGSFVPDTFIDYPVSRRTRFSENVIGADREPHARVLRTAELPAQDDIAAALGIAVGAPVILIETLRLADERPISVSSHHFPAVRFRGIEAHFRETGSVTQALFRLGVPDYFRDATSVVARLAGPWEARHLQQPESEPVLVTQSVNVDSEGRPIEYVEGRYAGRRVQLTLHPH